MNFCFICSHKTGNIRFICDGCRKLLRRPDYSCQVCATEIQFSASLCGDCQKACPAFSEVLYACSYEPPANHWVLSLKFSDNIFHSKLFAGLMLAELQKTDSEYALVPVPLHKSRLRRRGYNQAYELASELAKMSGRKLDTCLQRTRKTEMQAQLKLNQRAKNVKGAFTVSDKLLNRKLILVDDVMTSGYTLNECAKVLRKAGAEDIKVLVFARKSL